MADAQTSGAAAAAAGQSKESDAESRAGPLEVVRQDDRVRAAVRLFWDLMVVVSARFGGNGVDVNREGYRNFHLRVSKSLESTFDMETAETVANTDWAEDIAVFSGDSTDLIWLEEVKKKFREVTQETVARQGWQALFARYDVDGSGDIDFDEFSSAARTDLEMSVDTISDDDLRQLFVQADDDGSGELDSEEFCSWILAAASPDMSPHMRQVKGQFREAATPVVTKIGWAAVFAQYDTDGSGLLDKDEFISAVRKDCDISSRVVSDTALEGLFSAVDADGSGEIDCDEFGSLLTSDALAQDMTFDVFYESMFQLADLWTADPPVASNYEAFLLSIFGNITTGTGSGLDLRQLETMYDENGVLRYELALSEAVEIVEVEEIESYADAETGEVVIEGVEINVEAWGGEAEAEAVFCIASMRKTWRLHRR
jgi:Ca2+-binding EF-hand superfamily protein